MVHSQGRCRLVGALALLLAVLAPSRCEDYFDLTPEEMAEDLDGEVELPGGDIVRVRTQPLTRTEVKRDPFKILHFDMVKMEWSVPESEQAHKDTEKELKKMAWMEAVALDSGEDRRTDVTGTGKRLAARQRRRPI